MRLEIVNCFCTERDNSGNRAAIIRDFEGGKEDKQLIAKKLNLPVAVFITGENTDLPILDYFYPNSEMPLCLHGTISAAYVLLLTEKKRKIRFITSLNNYLLDVTEKNNLIQVKVTRQNAPHIQVDKLDVYKMLNLDVRDYLELSLPFMVASVGSPKLLIPVKSSDILFSLKPKLHLIKEWSIENQVNGLYVYAAGYDKTAVDFIARGFNPKTGHSEDAATGVATAALALCLKRSLIIEQGANLGAPCKIVTNYVDDQTIFVGGKVVPIISDEYLSILGYDDVQRKERKYLSNMSKEK